jgi:hypothetical protein
LFDFLAPLRLASHSRQFGWATIIEHKTGGAQRQRYDDQGNDDCAACAATTKSCLIFVAFLGSWGGAKKSDKIFVAFSYIIFSALDGSFALLDRGHHRCNQQYRQSRTWARCGGMLAIF